MPKSQSKCLENSLRQGVCVCAGIWINDLRTVFRILSDFVGEEGSRQVEQEPKANTLSDAEVHI